VTPKTQYARSGDTQIAFQVFGEGEIDLLISPGYISHLEMWWMIPESTAFLRRLASFARVIAYDKRGTGLSDPAASVPTMDERMEDLHAVLDAAGSERPAIFGYSEGGPAAVLFAATYPERVRALALYGTLATFEWSPGIGAELGVSREEWEALFAEGWTEVDQFIDQWGTGNSIDFFAPQAASEPTIRRMWAMFERIAAPPAMVSGLMAAVSKIDVTDVAGAVSAPTQITHRVGDPAVPALAGEYLARLIPNAEYVELPGDDHVPWLGDTERLLDEVEGFLTGAHAERPMERALATVLFTDIVGSTDRAAELGDARWRRLLEHHDELIRREVASDGGRVVKSLGDGVLARFDGPGRAIDCAQRIVGEAPQALGVEIRAGIHTGECEVRGEDLGGLAVHIGSRIGGLAQGGEVLVSRSVRDLVVGSPVAFADRGTHELKGVPGEWQVLAAAPGEELAAGQPKPSYEIAPNAELSRPSDRALARLARTAPGIGRGLNSVMGARARRRVRKRQEAPGAQAGA
jgi:class 3 adenylate cyclase/alpha-beta hydrolase superfamily lysophospholipase